MSHFEQIKALQLFIYAVGFLLAGDIIYLQVFKRPIIVLNNFDHAQLLMDKRGAIHSDRPRMLVIHDL